jgi:hypothetical protein
MFSFDVILLNPTVSLCQDFRVGSFPSLDYNDLDHIVFIVMNVLRDFF